VHLFSYAQGEDGRLRGGKGIEMRLADQHSGICVSMSFENVDQCRNEGCLPGQPELVKRTSGAPLEGHQSYSAQVGMFPMLDAIEKSIARFAVVRQYGQAAMNASTQSRG
jgi:hypothetical protein